MGGFMAKVALHVVTCIIWIGMASYAWAGDAGVPLPGSESETSSPDTNKPAKDKAPSSAADASGGAATAKTSASETGNIPEGAAQLPEIVVQERSDSMIGIADSSTQGTIGAQELEDRPISRPGEVLEAMPGVIVTQHSGDGKANQYFMRGFNLDHGTDLATDVNGVPINLPSNAHGEGYMDLNFLIPELIERIDYQKGPYFANVGNFGSAGSEDVEYFKTLPSGFATIEYGSGNYERALLADLVKVGPGNVLFALEASKSDGPWVVPENYTKYNGLFSYSSGDKNEGGSVTAMAYHATWDATNQTPQRAIDEGIIAQFGSLNPTDGGNTDRYTLEGEYHRADKDSASKIMAYSYYYNMNLWNDFTFFLDDPVHGDQFDQADSRWVQGVKGAQTWFGRLWNFPVENTVGFDLRNDIIHDGLYHTEDREVIGTTRVDDVLETGLGMYVENKAEWLPWFRTVAGFREDVYRMQDSSDLDANSGTVYATAQEPKLCLIFGPWAQTEFYINGGYGFHTNDARGANTTVDPNTGLPVNKADRLPQSQGAEIGVRTLAVPHLQSTLTFFMLDLDSELVFNGDSGTDEATGPSRRIGVEWGNYYTPTKWLTIDADYANSQAHYRDNPAGGDNVPEAASTIISSAITLHDIYDFSTSLRLRYFGPRALTQNDSVESASTTLLYYSLGYKINQTWSIRGDIFNLLNTTAPDISYYYTSRLPGEPAEGVNDYMVHYAEPFTVRLGLTMHF